MPSICATSASFCISIAQPSVAFQWLHVSLIHSRYRACVHVIQDAANLLAHLLHHLLLSFKLLRRQLRFIDSFFFPIRAWVAVILVSFDFSVF